MYCSSVGNMSQEDFLDEYFNSYFGDTSNFTILCENAGQLIYGWSIRSFEMSSLCEVNTFDVEYFYDCPSIGAGVAFFNDLVFIEYDSVSPITNWSLTQEYRCNLNGNSVVDWIDDFSQNAFEDDCQTGSSDFLTIVTDYNGDDLVCGDSLDVEFLVSDPCGNTSQFTFRFIVDNDPDGDGLEGDDDNCPEDYNPGQEDIDGDGKGNACDTLNEVGQFVVFEDNISISKDNSALLMRAQNGTCWAVTINNDGSLSTVSVACPE